MCDTAVGACDVEDTCDGSSPACVDTFKPATASCRASADLCDAEEFCTGTAPTCPANAPKAMGVECRPTGAGHNAICDPPETCDGSSFSCPADFVQSASFVCDADGAPDCDRNDICTADLSCPERIRPAGYACDAGGPGGDCDDANDVCDGLSGNGCIDAVLPAGTECRADVGVCDVAEQCDGTSPACPADAFEPATVSCRAAVGTGCDEEEFCTGTSNACPPDAKKPAGFECRPAAGACDVAEVCNGTGNYCPATDVLVTAGTECRGVAGDCDLAEQCTGSSAACPADAFRSASHTCRASVGVCDLVEKCTGAGPSCPADAKSVAECRASAGTCDPAEFCDGVGNTCPADNDNDVTLCDDNEVCTIESCVAKNCNTTLIADNDPCDDENLDHCANTSLTCQSGVCTGNGVPQDCDDSVACSVDSCDPAVGCVNEETPLGCGGGLGTPIEGLKLVIRNQIPDDEFRNKITFYSRDSAVFTPAPGSADDPRCIPDGGSGAGGGLVVQSATSGEAFSQLLPCGFWKLIGREDNPRGWRYVDRHTVAGPCKSVIILDGRIVKVVCGPGRDQALPYDLQLAVEQIPVSTTLTLGTGITDCAQFDDTGIIRKDGTDARRLIIATTDAAPTCP